MKLFKKIYKEEQEQYSEYGWVFIIVFFLVLFLSQALFISVFDSITSLFPWLLLVIWSIFVAYYLLFGNSHLLYNRVKQKAASFINRGTTKKQIEISTTQEPEESALKGHDKMERGTHFDVFEKKLEQEAHDKGALISGEGIKHIMSFGGGAENVLKDVIEKGRNTYPRFDGWVVLNKSQVISLLSHSLENQVPFSAVIEEIDREDEKSVHEDAVSAELKISPAGGENMAEVAKEESIHKTKNINAPVNLPTEALWLNNSVAAATFIGLLCDGDERPLFIFIQEMGQGSHNGTRIFIKEAILMLDRVHEYRMGGVCYVDQRALESTHSLSDEELEEIITILVGSVDYRYRLPEVGVKLSLVRALEYIKEHKKD